MANAPAPSRTYSRGALIITIRQLAKGHNSVVYLAERNSDKRPYAMKQIPRNNKRAENMLRLRANNPARSAPLPRTSGPTALVGRRGTEEAKIRREVAIMKKCNHPNIVKFFDFVDDQSEDSVYLLMEYMEGGELQWRGRGEDGDVPYLTMEQTRRVMRDIVLGIGYLHMQGIIHRDIKPSNIMWTLDRNRVKIGDFGVASLVESDPSSDGDFPRHAGTPSFLAPEIAPGGDGPMGTLTFAVDLWALGVTLYALLFGALPFEAHITDLGSVAAESSLYRSIREDPWKPRETMSSQSISISAGDWGNGGVLYLLNGLLTKEMSERFDDEALKGMMSYGWLFADIQQPNRWVQVTTPLFHPPLVSSPIPIPDHPHAGLSTPKPKKISVSKRDEANAIMEPKFKWPLSIGLGRRVSNLFRSPRDDAAEGRGAVKSNPERISRASTSHPSAKGKGKEAVPPLPPDDLPTTSRRGRGMFGTWRSGQDGGRASAARHSVEALGNTRVASAAVAAATSSSDGASGGVMLGSRSGTVTVVGGSGSGTHPLSISNEQRTSSLSNARPNSSSGPWAVNREWPQDPNADNSNEDEDLVRDGTLIGVGVGMGLIVMPRRLRDDIGSASASSHSGSSRSPSVGDYGDIDDDGHAPGPDDSDWGDEDHDYRRRDVYGETSSGDEDDEEGPIEFKRRVRPEPRGPGHGHDDAGAGD